MIDLGPQEVSMLAFFQKQTNFWLAATLWDAKVAFLQRPQKTKGGDILREKKVHCKHTRDVTSIDITDSNHMATASIDNSIIFWNTYNAREGKKVDVPSDMANDTNSIHTIKFASRDTNDFLFVFNSRGDIFILETQSETFVEPADFADERKLTHRMSHGKVPKFALVDVRQKMTALDRVDPDHLYILSVDESAKEGGILHQVTMRDPGYADYSSTTTNRRSTHKKSFTVRELHRFQIPLTEQIETVVPVMGRSTHMVSFIPSL